LNIAATLALHGLPALRYLHTTDHEERLMLLALANRVVEIDNLRQRNLAQHIIHELASALKRRG